MRDEFKSAILAAAGRKAPAKSTTPQELAGIFGVDQREIKRLQATKTIVMDAAGTVNLPESARLYIASLRESSENELRHHQTRIATMIDAREISMLGIKIMDKIAKKILSTTLPDAAKKQILRDLKALIKIPPKK